MTALTVLSAGSVSAQNWTGTTSNDWTIGSNWSTGTVPNGTTGTVTINAAGPILGVGGPATGATNILAVGSITGSTSSLTIQNGSVLTSTGSSRIAVPSGSIGTVTVTGAGSQWLINSSTFFVGFLGNATLNIRDGGRVLAAGGTTVGGFALASGTVNINGGGTLETINLHRGSAAAQLNFDNGILRATAANANFITGFSGSNLNVAAGGLTIDAATFAIGTDATSGFSGIGGLTVTGGGAFRLLANSTYSGQTQIQAGSGLTLQGAGAIASSSRVVADGTFNISGVTAAGTNIRSLAGSGGVALGAKNLTITNANDVFSGIISGTGRLTLSGGTQTLSGANTYLGGTTISAGTLQLGNGGASGSIIGKVTNNGVLAFNRNDVATFSGIVSGTGALSQLGSGTTILTGANTYTGGTSLNAGTLSVASDTNLGGVAGSLSFNGGTLQVTGTGFADTARVINWGSGGGGFDIANAANSFTVAQDLTGGALAKLGPGTLVLTGSNTFAGASISAGTLKLGNGGTSGSIAGDVLDNGTLAFNRSDATTFAGVISGSGAVSHIGTGVTTLTATNTYTGGTTISAGTLQLGNGGTSGGILGNVTDNGTLAFNRSDAVNFDGVISGAGAVNQIGAGTTFLNAANTYTGPTTIVGGTLSVNGSIANSAVTVRSGGTLGGNGTVGVTTIQSGGTIAPGNSIGTLHINGAFTQASGSVYQVQVDPNTNASDLIAVSGLATLQSGSGLNVVKDVAGDYRPGTVYTVLSASGGVTGTYTLSGDTVVASAFLGLRDSYDANNVYLAVVQTRDPALAAQTSNQLAVAVSLPASGTLDTAILNLPSDAAARSAFDQLSGEVYAAVKGALLTNGLYLREATSDRLRDILCRPPTDGDPRFPGCGSERLSLWMQGFGGWGSIAGSADASGLNHSTAGVLIGADVPVANWRVGVFGGYGHSNFDGSGAGGDSNDYHLGLYGGTRWDALALSLGASYTWNDITTNRAASFGDFSDHLRANYNDGSAQVFAELGYQLKVGQLEAGPTMIEPFANVAYIHLHTDGFTEAGGAAALTSAADSMEDTVTTLGIRPSARLMLGSLPVTVRGMIGWRHTFGVVTPTSVMSFAGGNPFTVSGAPIARDAAALETGVSFFIRDNISASLSYSGQFSSGTTDQAASGTIRISF